MTNRIRGALPVALAIAAVAATAADAAARLRQPARGGRLEDDLRRPRHDRRAHHHHRHRPAAPQPCDGTNAGAFPSPVPTATAALDDGARLNGFTWDADWFSSFSDFSVKDVAGDAANTTQFWGLVVNFQFSQTGGCTTKVNNGDEVLWVFDAFSKTHVLKLTGPASATTGAPVTRAGRSTARTASPAAGATVGGSHHRRRRPGDALVRQRRHLQAQGRARRLGPLERARRSASTRPAPTPAPRPTRPRRPSPPSLPGRRLASEQRSLAHHADLLAGRRRRRRRRGVLLRRRARGLRRRQKAKRRPATGSRSWSAPSSPASTSAATRAAPTSSASPRSIAPPTGPSIVTDPLVLPVDDRDRGLWKLSRGWKRSRSAVGLGRHRRARRRGRRDRARCASPAARSR